MRNKAIYPILTGMFVLMYAVSAACSEFVLVVDLEKEKPVYVDGDASILDRPISLGSTIKPFLAIAALNHGYHPETKVHCPASTVDTPPEERCWLVNGHGTLTLKDALAHSCSVYFRSLIRSLKKSSIEDVLGRFHLINDRESDVFNWMDSEDLIGASERLKIKPGRMMGAYCAAFAQKDLLDIFEDNGKIRVEHIHASPQCSNTDVIRIGLRKAALEGTFAEAQRSCRAVSVFGKTGTAAVEGKSGSWRGVFIGFAPYPIPRYVVLVIVEPGRGGSDAAPRGIQRLCELLSISLDSDRPSE